MHLYDIERGNIGANAVIGGGLPQITGAALAFQMRGEPRVAVAFFGDGATNIGTFHEALNLAQLWKVPAVFVLEDNHWAESTPESQHSPIRDLSERAKAFGMKALKADGQDVEAVYKTRAQALDHARAGKGPVFLHLDTVRFSGHYIGDPQVYRDRDEAKRAARDARSDRAAAREARDLGRGLRRARRRGDGDRRGRRSSSRRTAPIPRPKTRSRTSMPELTYREAVRDALVDGDARRTTTSSSWARTSPRWAARWASRRDCSTSSARSACATRRSPRWRSPARRSAPRCRACARSPRSCTRTS